MSMSARFTHAMIVVPMGTAVDFLPDVPAIV